MPCAPLPPKLSACTTALPFHCLLFAPVPLANCIHLRRPAVSPPVVTHFICSHARTCKPATWAETGCGRKLEERGGGLESTACCLACARPDISALSACKLAAAHEAAGLRQADPLPRLVAGSINQFHITPTQDCLSE